MSKEYVYLAGPMEDCSESVMTEWRTHVASELMLWDIDCLDPTRRVSFHNQLYDTTLQDDIRNMNLCKRIFKQDMQDIANSRVIIADVRRKSGRGTGTSMELMFAHMKNKILIMWGDYNDHIHPFYESIYTEKHYDLNDVIESVKEYY